MSCCSVPSQPTHLHSSKALAPTSSAIGLSDQGRPPIAKFLRSGLCTRHLEISPKESTISFMANNLKRVLLVVLFLMTTSFLGITSASAGEFCADGTWSNSSGKGTCSWHGGILGNTTTKKPSTYSDPWGTKTKVDPFGTTTKKPSTYSDPWSTTKNKSNGFCTYIDRSKGRC